jgi:hypothetical protein
MGLPRTFVGFSSTDINYYRMMQAWKANEHIDFDFVDCQLNQELNSEDESYIKRKCRERIAMSGTYLMLIGSDTRSRHKYVRWEAEVAVEKNCRLIGVNLNGKRELDADLCPPILKDEGAIFVPFKAKIIAYALQNFPKKDNGDWFYKTEIYQQLGL